MVVRNVLIARHCQIIIVQVICVHRGLCGSMGKVGKVGQGAGWVHG